MEFIKTSIPDVFICKPRIIEDDRGYFFESFKESELNNYLDYSINFCQDNEAKSIKAVLRGLHYQLPPFAQTKLVRVIQGKVLDVVVDIRKDSETFGKHEIIELSDENKLQLFVPKGFAHGYIVLSDTAIFSYKVDNYYSKECERGILYNDSDLNIDWSFPLDKCIISEKDLIQPTFKNAEIFQTKMNLNV